MNKMKTCGGHTRADVCVIAGFQVASPHRRTVASWWHRRASCCCLPRTCPLAMRALLARLGLSQYAELFEEEELTEELLRSMSSTIQQQSFEELGIAAADIVRLSYALSAQPSETNAAEPIQNTPPVLPGPVASPAVDTPTSSEPASQSSSMGALLARLGLSQYAELFEEEELTEELLRSMSSTIQQQSFEELGIAAADIVRLSYALSAPPSEVVEPAAALEVMELTTTQPSVPPPPAATPAVAAPPPAAASPPPPSTAPPRPIAKPTPPPATAIIGPPRPAVAPAVAPTQPARAPAVEPPSDTPHPPDMQSGPHAGPRADDDSPAGRARRRREAAVT